MAAKAAVWCMLTFYIDGIYLILNYDGEFENISILIVIGDDEESYREEIDVARDKESWKTLLYGLMSKCLTELSSSSKTNLRHV